MSAEERRQNSPAAPAFPILNAEAPRPAPARACPALRLAAALVLLAGALLPAAVALMVPRPGQTRDIHIEAYRYGFSPARIHANRGDRLRLTFSTRDTGQSFFLQDYDLHVAITPGDPSVAVQRLSRPHEPAVRTATVELVAGLPGWQGWLVSKSHYRNHTYNGPLHGTERGELIVEPNLLLGSGLGLLAALPLAGLLLAGGRLSVRPDRRVNLFGLAPWLKRMAKSPAFQSNLTLPMLGVFWFIILAGLLGTKVSGRNAGPMIIWVLWLSGLIILLVPIGGRIWCTVCPLPLLGEWMQRRRLSQNPTAAAAQAASLFGLRLVWPEWLKGAWPRVLLFLLLGTFSTNIVALPPATSWMLIGLVALAVVVSVFPEQRLFCRHLCPINSYISLYSTTGRLMVRAASTGACDNCKEKFCLTGSIKGWGCPYGLCVADIDRNNDCGLCLECVKTCAYDNVGLYWRPAGWDRGVADLGEAWQAIVMWALACLYCYINLGAWDRIRDWTDLLDKQNWSSFAVFAVAVWVVCLALLPGLWYGLARAGVALGRLKLAPGEAFRSSTAALIPLGLGCWIAFALATALSMKTFVLQSLSDPFNWGWDLLGTAGSPWHIVWSPAIPWMQVVCVLAGAAAGLQTLYRTWLSGQATRRQALLASLPLGAFVWLSAGAMVCFFAG